MIERKICMVGSFGVGKTSLVARYIYSRYTDKYLTTVGVKVDRKETAVDGTPVKLIVWDLAGEDAHTTVKPSHLRGAAGYVLVIDGTRRATLDVAVDLQRRATEAVGAVPFVCAINKLDLREKWEITDADLAGLTTQGWDWLPTSAATGDAVETLFQRLAAKTLKDRNESPAAASLGG